MSFGSGIFWYSLGSGGSVLVCLVGLSRFGDLEELFRVPSRLIGALKGSRVLNSGLGSSKYSSLSSGVALG
jgi:hypothetical protein